MITKFNVNNDTVLQIEKEINSSTNPVQSNTLQQILFDNPDIIFNFKKSDFSQGGYGAGDSQWIDYNNNIGIKDYIPIDAENDYFEIIHHTEVITDLHNVLQWRFTFFDENKDVIGQYLSYYGTPTNIEIPSNAIYYTICFVIFIDGVSSNPLTPYTPNDWIDGEIQLIQHRSVEEFENKIEKIENQIISINERIDNLPTPQSDNHIKDFTFDVKPIQCLHRGWHLNGIPEDSVASIYFAAKYGYDMVELDLQETSDNNFVLCHDSTINSSCMTTSYETISSTVSIYSTTFDTLRNNYVRKSPDPRYRTKITSLDEALIACRNYNIVPQFEVKTNKNLNDALLRVYNSAQNILGSENFGFNSFNQTQLDYARTLSDKILLFYLGSSILNTIDAYGNSRNHPNNIWFDSSTTGSSTTKQLVSEYKQQNMNTCSGCWSAESFNHLKKCGCHYFVGDPLGINITIPTYIISSDENWNNFVTDGVISSDNCITLNNSQTLTISFNSRIYAGSGYISLISKGSLQLSFTQNCASNINNNSYDTFIGQFAIVNETTPTMTITAKENNVSIKSIDIMIKDFYK